MDISEQKRDWEGIIFPFTLTQIESKTHHYNFPFNSELTIWRDDKFRLRGSIKGIADNEDDFQYKENGTIKKVGIIKGETLNAKSNSVEYIIKGLGVSKISANPFQEQGVFRFNFSCDVYLEEICFLNNSNKEPDILCEWYICSLPDILFGQRTIRCNSHPTYKVRVGLDSLIKDEKEYYGESFSTSWDFALINYDNFNIILQMVSKDNLSVDIDGISIEYRSNDSKFPSLQFRKMFSEYIGFILGTSIQLIGTSEFHCGYVLHSSKSYNLWNLNVKKNANINPIPVSDHLDLNYFENQLNQLLPNFIKIYENTSLSDCLHRLWAGSTLPIGINLPIIASGFEILINSYLKNNKFIRKYTDKEKSDYKQLISDDLESIKHKLADYDFAPFVINKIANPYTFGIGEKFNIFFKSISMDFEKNSLENRALKARNLMTHSGVNTDSDESKREILKLSYAYITLVNRVILKLIDYNLYYVDYSSIGVRHIKMNENM